jgi:hypothetical protein
MTEQRLAMLMEKYKEVMPTVEKLTVALELVKDIPNLLIRIEALQNRCKELSEFNEKSR